MKLTVEVAFVRTGTSLASVCCKLLAPLCSSRAVGSANGANAIAVLIPCHRVVPASGSVGGYAYGPDALARDSA